MEMEETGLSVETEEETGVAVEKQVTFYCNSASSAAFGPGCDMSVCDHCDTNRNSFTHVGGALTIDGSVHKQANSRWNMNVIHGSHKGLLQERFVSSTSFDIRINNSDQYTLCCLISMKDRILSWWIWVCLHCLRRVMQSLMKSGDSW
jgi:hypothetical protein